jgi:hypothetical protein
MALAVSLDAEDPAAGHILSKWMRFVTSHLIYLTSISAVFLYQAQIFQSVSWSPLIANASARFQASKHEICGGHSGTRTSFSSNILDFLCQYHSTNTQYQFIHLWRYVTLRSECRYVTNFQSVSTSDVFRLNSGSQFSFPYCMCVTQWIQQFCGHSYAYILRTCLKMPQPYKLQDGKAAAIVRKVIT